MTWQDVLMVSLPTLLAGVVGYGSAARAFGQQERRTLRLTAADSVIPRIDALRRLVRIPDRQADGAEWHAAAAAALDAIDAERHRLPPSWQHLQQSVRIAIGETTGVYAFADRTPYEPDIQPIPYSREWASNAEEYLTYALRNLRVWRDEVRGRPRTPELVPFDEWLRRRDLQSGARQRVGTAR